MANFKIASTLLCVLLIGQNASAVINKSAAPSTSDKDTTETKDEIVAEDRIISEVYGAPPQLSNEYGPPPGEGSFSGPAPVYGPPELTGQHGPVQVHPPPPPELPPPPPHSFGPPRKPKPHFGPPKQPFGPPPPNFGPKPSFGPPKLHFGPPPPSFGPPRPHGPPPKFSGPPNHQFGPPRFGGHKPGGHGPPIPTSLEHYGPPNREPSVPFDAAPSNDFSAPSAPQSSPPHGQHGPNVDLYGPPPQSPPPGVPAPPTPPDIKYDGWQPIAGLVGSPNNHEAVDNTYGPPPASSSISSSHSSSSQSSFNHLSDSHSSSLVIETPKQNVPSNSYGEPIHNQEAQNFQSSVVQSTNSQGLPPPPLPQSEPLHNNQGPAQSIPGHQEHNQHHASNDHSNLFGSSDLFNGQFDHALSGELKVPNLEILPDAGPLSGSLHGFSQDGGGSFGGFSSSSFSGASSNSFHSDVTSTVALPVLPQDTYGAPPNVNNHQQDSHALLAGSGDLSVQQLPYDGPSPNFGGNSFGGFGKPGPSPPIDSYGAPPPTSYSPSGRYPAAQSPRGGSWHSSLSSFGSSSFNKHSSGGSHHHHRSHGPPRFGPLPPPPPHMSASFIPPRNRAPIKFRERIPPAFMANINRYLPPISKPSINYGVPIEQQLPSLSGAHSFKSSFSNSLGHSFNSGNSFAKDNPFSLNTRVVAPHVQYGTPFPLNDFNTPAPVLTYGAPNFGPAYSFISTSFGNFGSGGNLYKNMGSTGLTATYGTPVHGGAAPIHGGSGIPAGHDCGFQNSGSQISSQLNSFEDVGHPASSGASAQHHQTFTNSLQSSALVGNINSEHSNSQHQFTNFPTPSVHELDLESHEQQQGELKDSYGNPIPLSIENVDQAGAALTTNAVHANSESSSSGYSSHEDVSQHSHGQHQNSYASGGTFTSGNGLSAEALTAALTAQGYGQAKNYASNELAQDTSNHYTSIHDSANEALQVALQAEGADGFQIQGSKGTYTLQIQSADGSLGTENSDGSIRHDQVLSNGLLQDILAAIEQPNGAPVQIQGAPQPQQLQQVYEDAVANGAQQHQVSTHQNQQHQQSSHNEIVQQVLSVQGLEGAPNDLEKPLAGDEQVALFFNSHGGYEESRKDIRSTSKSDAQAVLASNEVSRAQATKKSS
ncbi:atrophin-1-like [Venturia canescens]|uniref:atrophin-1-like n=1 Tax=Venturia canescens TaxID=32260 RepID=UPI001C9D545A|nr:atrophin-1-like [Venturia canescens]